MVDYTPTWSLPYPAASDSVRPESRDFMNLALGVAAGLTSAKDEAIEAANFWKGTLASSVNLDTITEPGFYGYWASNPNNPAGVSGVMFVGQIDSNLVQIAYNFTSPQAWKRSRGGGTWSAWAQIGGPLVRPRATTEVGTATPLATLVKEGSWTVYVADAYPDRPAQDVNAILDVTWYRDNAWEQTWRSVQDDYAVWKRRTLNSGDTWTEWERVATTRVAGIIPLLANATSITDLNNLVEEGFWTVRQSDSFANSPDPASNTAVIQCRMYRANGWEQTWRTVMNGNYATWRRHTIDNGANWYPWTQISGSGGSGGGAWTPQDSVFFWGDSAVKGGEAGEAEWPAGTSLWERLNALLTVPVENRAVGGYVANNVLLRAGILRVHARPVGGSIPASGEVDLEMDGQDFTSANGFNMPVTWNGVAGTLIRSSTTGNWFFRRTGSGSATSVANPTELVSSWRQDFTTGTHIYMMAGNDWAQDTGLPDEGSLADHVVATYLRALYAGPATGERHVLLAGVKTRQNTEPGDLNHQFVQHVNDRLRKAAPANFVSRQDWLVRNALRARGLTPTAEDEARMAAGIIPARAFADVTHIHRDVVALEAKELWLPALANRGWVAPNAAGLAALDAMPPRPETPVLDDDTPPTSSLNRNVDPITKLLLDTGGGFQFHVNGTRVFHVNSDGRLSDGVVDRLNRVDGLSEVVLGSGGSLQFQVNGTRVWRLDETGHQVEGTVNWDRVTGEPIDVVIMAGQSNAVYKWRDLTGPTPYDENPKLMVWNEGGQPYMATIAPTHQEDVGKGFAREYLRRYPNRQVILIPAAVGSTGFLSGKDGRSWDRHSEDNLYDAMIQMTSDAMTMIGDQLGHVMMLWVQGERDRTVMTESEYAAAFDDLVTTARSDLGRPNMPVIVGSMTPAEIAATAPEHQGVARAHVDTPRRLFYSAYQFGPVDYEQLNERIHYSAAGNTIKGAAMVDALHRARLNMDTVLPIMPHGLAIHRNGQDVKVTWEAPPCRFTAFNLEISLNGGAWTAQAKSGPIATEASFTAPAGSKIQARVSTTNEDGTSAFSDVVTSAPTATDDTGVLDLTPQATNITAGTLTFQHKNGWNVLRFTDVVAAVGNNNLLGNGSALAPWAPLDAAGEVYESVSANNTRNEVRSVLINYLGAVRCWDIQSGDVLNGSIVWPMNRPMPA